MGAGRGAGREEVKCFYGTYGIRTLSSRPGVLRLLQVSEPPEGCVITDFWALTLEFLIQ